MPAYQYFCYKCHTKFWLEQSIKEDPFKFHEDCGGKVQRIIQPVASIFKGPGFHITDYKSHKEQ